MEVSTHKAHDIAFADILGCLITWHIFPERFSASSTISMVEKLGSGLDGW